MDEETREVIAILTSRLLGIREVVARLLAYEALRHDDPSGILRHFSEATDHGIHRAAVGLPIGPKTMAAQEAARAEVDWMIAAARIMIDRAEER